MRKVIEVSEDTQAKIKSMLEPGESYDAWLRRWLGLPAVHRPKGRPRVNPVIEKAPSRSEWYLVGELKIGEHIDYSWPVAPDGGLDEAGRSRLNPGIMRMAKRAGIKVIVESANFPPIGGLRVTRTA